MIPQQTTSSPSIGVVDYERKGTGPLPRPYDTVTVHYSVSTKDNGFVIESVTSASLVLGKDLSEYITSVLVSTPVGSKFGFECNGASAFGPLGLPGTAIEWDTMLLFSFELLEVSPPTEAATVDQEELKCLALKLKEEGNKHIESDPLRAKQSYLQALALFEQLPSLSTPDHRTLQQFLLPFYSNIALCEIKTQNVGSALSFAKKILKEDPFNAKANFRVGQALECCNKWNPAIWYFEQSNKVEPSKGTQDRVKRVKLLKDNERKGKNMFVGMLKREEHTSSLKIE